MNMQSLTVGGIVTLGRYPQGANGEVLPIQWQVLDVREDRALLLSRYILDAMPFAEDESSVWWGDSRLRRWLAEDFVARAFTAEEWAGVMQPAPSEHPELDQLTWQMGMDDATDSIHDAVFALSSYDIGLYYPGENHMFCPGATAEVTPWVAARESDFTADTPCWWLRSSSPRGFVFIVSPCDSVGVSMGVHQTEQGVRPALWVRTEG